MRSTSTWKTNGILWVLLLLLVGLILCPLITVFARAVIIDGRLDLSQAWSIIADKENLQTIFNSLLLGVCVVLCSTVIAAPTAYLLARTQLAKHRWMDIVFMVPFMTPPYIASMGWILFMQRRGLFQQLFPFTGRISESFFSFGGLVLVMTLNVFPFMMTILKNAILNIPASLEESGAVFGAGFGLRLRKIFAPLLTGNYAIAALLRQSGFAGLTEGTLYPLLLRLERKGLIRAEYRASPSGPSRKYYLLTPAGKTYLVQFIDAWRETSAGVETILNGGPKGGTPDVL